MGARTFSFGAAVLCGVAAICAACSQTTTGTSTPTDSGQPGQPTGGAPMSNPPASGGGGSSDAPKVSNPVDVARFQNSPCDFLTSDQVKTLGISTEKQVRKQPVGGVFCQWGGGADGPSVAAGLLPNPHGLADTYNLSKTGQIDPITPVPNVNGFPAVKGLAKDEGPSACGYTIGLNDQHAVLVQVHNITNGDSCNAVLQVARDVTITAKGRS